MSRSPLPSTVAPSGAGWTLKGGHVLAIILTFFGIVIGVNVIMMTLAVRTLPGTDEDSPYRASLAYEGEIHAAAAQDRRAWRVEAHVTRDTDGHAVLRVEARDRDGTPLEGVAFSGRLERPADKRGDRVVALTGGGAGIYRGAVADIAAGQWDLVLEGERGSERVFLSRNRIVLK